MTRIQRVIDNKWTMIDRKSLTDDERKTIKTCDVVADGQLVVVEIFANGQALMEPIEQIPIEGFRVVSILDGDDV